MPTVYPSANMNLPIPVAGEDPGPDYARNVNSSLTIVDAHNHSPGQGLPIGPDGLNINADLPLNSNNLTTARSVRFSPQDSAIADVTDIGCLYEVGVDLYYNDGAGNQIRFTQGGSIAGAPGTITGLPSGTASASYGAGTFTFQSATSTAANIDGGSYVFRNSTASSKGLTLSPPNAMGADYSLTLPSVPASTKIMSLDSSGNMAASYGVDNSTIEISSNTIQVKAGGITATQIANATIPGSKIASATITGTNLASDLALTGSPTMDGAYVVSAHANDSSAPQIIAGIIGSIGNVVAGVGFSYSVVSGPPDIATITFTQSFSSIVGITITSYTAPNATVPVITARTLNSFSFRCWDAQASANSNATNVSFIVMGLR